MEYPEAYKGTCLTCGFLAKHPTTAYAGLPAPRFYEIEPYERVGNHEQMFRHTPDLANRMQVRTVLVCFIDQADLMLGIPGDEANTNEIFQIRRDLGIEAIARDRQCPGWYPYRPGLSPKEHYEVLEMQRLEQDRRAFEKQLSEMTLNAQERGAIIASQSADIAKDSKQIVTELKAIAEKSEKSSRRIAWLVILLAIAQVVVGLIALWHESYVDQFLRHIFGPLNR